MNTSSSSTLYDFNVKLVGLHHVRFDYANDKNIGIRFRTDKLKKIKKPAEDRRDGQVFISDEIVLRSTAAAETKFIHQNTATSDSIAEKDGDEVVNLAKEVAQKVTVEGCGGEVVNQQVPVVVANDDKIKQKPCQTGEDEGDHRESETESDQSDDDEPVDKILKEEHSARFLYKCSKKM